MTTVAAVDLGATSGRVLLGTVTRDSVALTPVSRFPNTPVRTIDGLHWNILELYRNVLEGLGAAARTEPGVASIGIDSWAVDYALLRDGRMLGTPYSYRDARTERGVARTHQRVGAAELYAANGLQYLPFNTLYQLAVDDADGMLPLADTMLLLPDLLGFWLSGERVAERSNASTTGLLALSGRAWNDDLVERLRLPRRILPVLVDAGATIGRVLPEVGAEVGLATTVDLVAVGSHDTASAVVAVPATSDDFAYISCGTWGLVGVELAEPVLSEAGRAANFTNEGGVDGRVRFLHNVMGLWLLSECVRTWEQHGDRVDLAELLAGAAAVTSAPVIFDANDPRLMPPGDMPARIADVCRRQGLAVPESRAELVRAILESLAEAFARAVHTAADLSGTRVRVVHLVGGGSQNDLLCQLTADRLGIPLLAGPVEATAIGNVLVQARSPLGAVSGSLDSLRSLVASSTEPRPYSPRAATVRS